jgi:hypothetical protein
MPWKSIRQRLSDFHSSFRCFHERTNKASGEELSIRSGAFCCCRLGTWRWSASSIIPKSIQNFHKPPIQQFSVREMAFTSKASCRTGRPNFQLSLILVVREPLSSELDSLRCPDLCLVSQWEKNGATCSSMHLTRH